MIQDLAILAHVIARGLVAAGAVCLSIGAYLLIVPRLQDRARWARLQAMKSGRRPLPSVIAWLAPQEAP